ILAISVKKAWLPIFYTASGFTWLIFLAWAVNSYSPENHLYLGLSFAGIFFSIFYAVQILYGVVHGQVDQAENIVSTVVTTLIFYAFCGGLGNASLGIQKYTFFFSFLAFFALAIFVTSYRFYGRILVFVT